MEFKLIQVDVPFVRPLDVELRELDPFELDMENLELEKVRPYHGVFSQLVETHLSQGWECHGQVSVTYAPVRGELSNVIMTQAMIRKKP